MRLNMFRKAFTKSNNSMFVIIYQPVSLVKKLSPTNVLNNSLNTF